MAEEEDSLEWELDNGVPQVRDPFIQKYLQGRHALIEQEHKQRHGQLFLSYFHFPSISPSLFFFFYSLFSVSTPLYPWNRSLIWLCLDYTFKNSMSAVAKEACRIVSHIRLKELRTVWSQSPGSRSPGEPYESDEVLFPGVMFTIAKERMEKTKLWEIVHRMPKG